MPVCIAGAKISRSAIAYADAGLTGGNLLHDFLWLKAETNFLHRKWQVSEDYCCAAQI